MHSLRYFNICSFKFSCRLGKGFTVVHGSFFANSANQFGEGAFDVVTEGSRKGRPYPRNDIEITRLSWFQSRKYQDTMYSEEGSRDLRPRHAPVLNACLEYHFSLVKCFFLCIFMEVFFVIITYIPVYIPTNAYTKSIWNFSFAHQELMVISSFLENDSDFFFLTHEKWKLWRHVNSYGCWTKNRGILPPKMDGENNGKPY